jgi:mono/diheme cytochrome c family protein
MRILLASLTSAMTLGAGASKAVTEEVDYLRQVKPILKQRCYACHGALKQKAGLRLDTGEAIRRGGEGGAIVNVQEPGASELLARLTSSDPDERMPPKGEGEALSPDEIARLRTWIAHGASSPADEKPEPDPRDHWAFKPPGRPSIPDRGIPGLPVRNPIDALVGASLARHGLVPSPEARKETLLRRLYLDLIGLPPTREELTAFLADPAPDAYEKTVDRLLASPRHAERWARHWMDIWRYADWYGRRHVPDVWNSAPQVWRWRDWIVQSLDQDKGYDRMLTEMLAADEVAARG